MNLAIQLVDLTPNSEVLIMNYALARFSLIALSVTISLPTQATSCAEALIQDRTFTSEANSSDLATYMLFEDIRESSSGGGMSGTVFGKGSLSGNRFKANSHRFRQENSSIMNSDRLFSLATQKLSRNSVDAYRDCLQSLRQFGTRVTIHDATDEAVNVTIVFLGAPDVDSGQLELSLGEGNTLTEPFPTAFGVHRAYSRIVTREPGTDFRVTAGFGYQPDSAFVSRTVLPYVPPPWRESSVNFTNAASIVHVGDGYRLTDLKYDNTGHTSPSHLFTFSVRNQEGELLAEVYHEQHDKDEWADWVGNVSFDDRTLDFAFSKYNDGRGDLNYSWRDWY